MKGDNNNIVIEKRRIVSLDVLRGLMLVIMTLDHFAGPIRKISFQPLGYVSAAEGFIYLSGYVYGLVYTRVLINGNFDTLKAKSYKRAAIIYVYHIFILLIVIVPLLLNVINYEELNVFKDKPVRSALFFCLFLLQPQNMDILPIYVVFVMIGPVIIKAFSKNKAKKVFIISGLLWLLSQLTIFRYNIYELGHYGISLGYFNLFSWQFLFFLGIYLGYFKTTGKYEIPITKLLFLTSLVVFTIFLIARYLPGDSLINQIFLRFADRSSLGITRLLNFGAIAYLIYIISIKKKNFLNSKWLSLLGRNSLQVFSYSVCLVYFFRPIELIVLTYGLIPIVIINILLVISLSLPARIHEASVRNIPYFKELGL